MKNEKFYAYATESNSSLLITIDFYWIIKDLERRLGKCPDDVKKALIDMAIEENND